jgi:osmoprotectant transport system permease protein
MNDSIRLRLWRLPSLLIAALGLSGCVGSGDEIRIGSDEPSKQRLLAEIMALTLEEEGMRVERVIPSGSGRANLVALRTGTLDLYPEYDGTLLALAGTAAAREDTDAQAAAADANAAAATAPDDLAAAFGLRWLEPFGFSERPVVAVRRDFALRHGLETVSDLAALSEPLDVAANTLMLERPRDGLYPLARFYGLPLDEVTATAVGDREAIYGLLLNGRVQAAIVSSIDAQAAEYGIALLEDDLDFFPRYQAAPLASAAAVEKHPGMVEALAALGGRITDADMQRLLRQIDSGGLDYREVARSFLFSVNMTDRGESGDARLPTITLAIPISADIDEIAVRSARALRSVLPGRPLDVVSFGDPGAALRNGEASIALLGAEDFFRIGGAGLERIEGMEVVGVAGNRYAHLLTHRDTGLLGQITNLRIGVGPEGGSSYGLATRLLESLNLENAELIPISEPAERAAMLRDDRIDALLLMVSLGNAALTSLLADDSDLELRSINRLGDQAWGLQYPYLRRARIPAGTYPTQTEPVATISSQAVLATPVSTDDRVPGEAGPMYTRGLGDEGYPSLPPRTARRLQAALGQVETPDPVLPISTGLVPSIREPRKSIAAQPAFAVLNVLAIVFLVWVGSLFFKPLPEEPALTSQPRENDQE